MMMSIGVFCEDLKNRIENIRDRDVYRFSIQI